MMTRVISHSAVIGLVTIVATLRAATPQASDGGKRPGTAVIAELFTSEGCSSCPPADALLERLMSQQPIDGVEVVALEEHVDYWDRLGWRDPFSSPLFTQRQTDYGSRVFKSNDIYTPQLVVDGASACIGSDLTAARRALIAAAAGPRATLHVEAGAVTADRLPVVIGVEIPEALRRHEDADVVVAVTERALTTAVRGGENRGRTLVHSAVVRSMAPVSEMAAGSQALTIRTAIPLAPGWNRDQLQIVAFVQERDSRHVLGGAVTTAK